MIGAEVSQKDSTKILIKDAFEYSIPIEKFIVTFENKGEVLEIENEEFVLDFDDSFTILSDSLYNILLKHILQQKNYLKGFCEVLNLKESKNEFEFCEGLKFDEEIKVPFKNYEKFYNAAQTTVNLKIKGRMFGLKSLFLVQLKSLSNKMPIDEVKKSHIYIKFGFKRGKRNILGMNFFDEKIIEYDSFTNVFSISQSQTREKKENELNLILKIEMINDIVCFVVIIFLLFKAIIEYDKFCSDSVIMEDSEDGEQAANEETQDNVNN